MIFPTDTVYKEALNRFSSLITREENLFDSLSLAVYLVYTKDPSGFNYTEAKESETALESLCSDAETVLSPFETEHERFRVLLDWFYHKEGFQGNHENYYAPENSLIHEVIKSKRGLPIALASLLAYIGSRCGLPIRGVGSPGHFVVMLESAEGYLYASPFDQTSPVRSDEMAYFLSKRTGLPEQYLIQSLKPSVNTEVLYRMVQNLKNAYVRENNIDALLRSFEWALAIRPEAREEKRDFGLILLRTEQKAEGAKLLLEYIREGASEEEEELIKRETINALRGEEE